LLKSKPRISISNCCRRAPIWRARRRERHAGWNHRQRWQSLLASDSVSRQEVEEKAGDFTTKQSMVNAATRANVDRYWR